MNRYLALVLLAVAAPTPEIRYFRYQRPMIVAPMAEDKTASQTCLALDPNIYAHASQQLADLRLYRDNKETPYLIHQTSRPESSMRTLTPINLGIQGKDVTFDALMPGGTYGDLQLEVLSENFLATVKVTGDSPGSRKTTLGDFTIFDFTRQRLGRNTVLHLPPSNFPRLHFQVAGPLRPENIPGISVTGAPADQTRFQQVAETSRAVLKGHTSTLELSVPAKVPVDRVVFVVAVEPANFSRRVTIAAAPVADGSTVDTDPPQAAMFSGSILRLHRTEGGHRIDEERLSVDIPAPIVDRASKWTVAMENGDDAPLMIQAVSLQMRERNLCFDAKGSSATTLFYGDPALAMPHYDYAELFRAQDLPLLGQTGPEEANPAYQPRPDDRPFTEKHPILLWIALVAVVLSLGAIAVRTAKSPTASSR